MCLILIAWKTVEGSPLVAAANRDEVMSRGTRPAAFWPDSPDVLAGRDTLHGGTWLGVTRAGRFAALTNYRDPSNARDDTPSRGQLTAAFLRSGISPEEYLASLQASASRYNGYNLVFGDRNSLWYFSNIEGRGRALSPGIYGLSNHLLDTPWPKVARAKSALRESLAALPWRDPLFTLLRDDTLAPDHELPRTGVSLEWERLLSAAFIRGGSYGTLSSTVVVQSDQHTRFEEITWSPEGAETGRVRVQMAR
ncbi:MAG: hypothetical protein RIR70_1605 [Pseudomonadota bacterium]|jgi:uncharacterized protein with NRDE domain